MSANELTLEGLLRAHAPHAPESLRERVFALEPKPRRLSLPPRRLVLVALGPLVFIATFVILAYSIAVIAGRPIRLSLSPRVQRRIVIGALLALGLNWATKLIWLGM